MSKVEELREALIGIYSEDIDAPWMRTKLDSLIAAAREEGAEQLAAKIKTERCHLREGFAVGLADHLVYDKRTREYRAACDLYIVPATVLAPTEPEEKP